MTNKNSQLIIIPQIIISFLLSVFGNKISELFSLKPAYIIIIVIILLLITILLSLPKQKYIFDQNRINIIITRNKTLIVPLFFLFGCLFSSILINLFDMLKITLALGFTFYVSDDNGQEFYVYVYEILAYIAIAYLIWITRKINLDFKLIIMSLFGGAAGIALSIFTFKPYENSPIETFFGGFITCIVILSIIEFTYQMKLQIKNKI
ncbi:hypothetical protein HZQ82_17660 [Elizabethkingia anophelis]|nr:hypothetical protein [Elizabethkingia anophelis]